MCYGKMSQDWQNEATKIRWIDLVKAEREIYLIYCNSFPSPHKQQYKKHFIPWLTHLQTISLQSGQQSLLKG